MERRALENQDITSNSYRKSLDYHYGKILITYITRRGRTIDRLNVYLLEIDKQAQERFERFIEGMKQAQGITEQLKAENAFEWIGRMNNILACVREIVNEKIIFA